jgi:hypothetical protein
MVPATTNQLGLICLRGSQENKDIFPFSIPLSWWMFHFDTQHHRLKTIRTAFLGLKMNNA